MSLTQAAVIECPYCMTYNDIEIDEQNDIGQTQILDCQICCQPIEVTIYQSIDGFEIVAKRDDE